MSDFKVEFSDANNHAQYDHSAADLQQLLRNEGSPALFVGDRDSISMVQLQHRNITHVINCHKDNHGLSKEEGVTYLNTEPLSPLVQNKAVDDALEFISKWHSQGKPVMVSCETGRAQSACIGVAWLVKQGMNCRDALAAMERVRPRTKLRPELMVLVDCPRLLERDGSAISVVWKAQKKGTKYELQMSDSDGEEAGWRTLSATLAANSVRKKNLSSDGGALYRFRYRYSKDDFTSGWSHPSEPLSTLPSITMQMSAPTVASFDLVSATLKWEAIGGAEGYQIRYRKEGDEDWATTKTIGGTEVRKKNLETTTYYFSVLPMLPMGAGGYEWSVSSAPAALATAEVPLSPFLAKLFPASLKTKQQQAGGGGKTITTKEALAGKITAVYFSASWCGPCRNFTPVLARVYAEAKAKGLPFEVVFCSADHSEEEFDAYYGGHHPWLALDYNADEREGMMGKFSVKGIPQLSILDTQGRFIEPNAVQSGGVSIERVQGWCASLKK